MVEIQLYNTASRSKEVFTPIKEGEIGIYCCGPTVYNFAHIGNLRAYIFDDILRRMFEYNNYKVNQVINITDVGHLSSDADEGEDKMLKGAKRENKTVWDIARFYEEAFFKDLTLLNIQKPSISCRATEHISEMIELIERLEKKGFTYEAEGNIYFDITKFSDYGKMAGIKLGNLEAGARIEVDENKKNPHDFVLWFTNSKFKNQAMQWDSPWGRGFPGWHIECSAMSMKYLGEQFDIHCGGIDHIQIHHTNEIAQSEGATGKKWVNYWLHNEFLVLNKGKMSKSGDSFIILQTLKDKGFDPIVFRYFCLGSYYRKQLNFSFEALEQAQETFSKLKERIIELKEDLSCSFPDAKIESEYKSNFIKAINEDLNTSKALAIIHGILADKTLGSKEKYELILNFDKVLGFGVENFKKEKFDVPSEIQDLIKARGEARESKDWTKADEVRDKIKALGFTIDDTPAGPVARRL